MLTKPLCCRYVRSGVVVVTVQLDRDQINSLSWAFSYDVPQIIVANVSHNATATQARSLLALLVPKSTDSINSGTQQSRPAVDAAVYRGLVSSTEV